MWVQDHLKVPDERSWIALTRVDPDGTVTRLGYASNIGPFAAGEINEIKIDAAGILLVKLRPDAEQARVTVNRVL